MRRAALVALLAATACGSTAQVRGTVTNDGLGVPSLDGGPTATSQATQSTSVTTPDGPQVSGTTGSTTGRALPRTDGPSATATTVLPTGVAPVTGGKPILVGIPYIDSGASNAFLNSLGKGLASGDTKAAYTARIADLNTKGGILGRKLQGVFLAIDINSSPGQYQAAACAAFTQDHKVQYVFDFGLGDTFLSCMAKAGVGVISPGNSLHTAAGMAKFPGYVQPIAMALDRMVRTQASEFLALGFFSNLKTAKVGILYYDQPEFVTAEKLFEQELKARGINVVARQAMTYVDAVSKVPQVLSEGSNTVLKFHAAGVTHVLAVEENAWLTGAFGLAAGNQSYYPRYGYTSQEPLGNIAANVSAKELKGAMFLGWDPVYDVPDLKQLMPGARTCLASFRGQPQDSPNQRAVLIQSCEAVTFLKSVLTAAGRVDGAPSLVDGASKLTGFASAITFQTQLTRTRHDGVVAYRPGAWNDSCACFAYTGALRKVPA